MWKIKLQRNPDDLENIETIKIDKVEEPTVTYCNYMKDKAIFHGILYEIVKGKEEYRAGFCNGK